MIWMRLRQKRKRKQRLQVLSDTGMKKAQDSWAILRVGGSTAAGLEIPSVRTDILAAGNHVRFALGENGEARLLLPLKGNETRKRLFGAPALQIETSTFVSAERKIRFLDLTCLSKDLESVFAEVSDEITARIANGECCIEAASSTIEDFRALLVRSPSASITTSAITGLIGELLVLDRLLVHSSHAWQCWRGPTGDRHDFRCRDSSLEVKTTTRAGRSLITVSGLDQMEAPAGGSLHLAHLVLEPVAAGKITVATLGKKVLDQADDRSRVKELMAAVGCPDVEADAWNRLSYRLEVETLYEVGNGFPRLVPSILTEGDCPAGISEISYRIDLSLAAEFVRDPSKFDELLKEFAQCH